MSDYISIHDAIAKINERAREKFSLNVGYEYYLEALNDIMDDLVQLSTIEAVPVKHGEWLPYEWCTDGTWDKCSVCGVAHRTRSKYIGFMDQKEHVFQEQLNYCPNCGAKMDGGKDDENMR